MLHEASADSGARKRKSYITFRQVEQECVRHARYYERVSNVCSTTQVFGNSSVECCHNWASASGAMASAADANRKHNQYAERLTSCSYAHWWGAHPKERVITDERRQALLQTHNRPEAMHN